MLVAAAAAALARGVPAASAAAGLGEPPLEPRLDFLAFFLPSSPPSASSICPWLAKALRISGTPSVSCAQCTGWWMSSRWTKSFCSAQNFS